MPREKGSVAARLAQTVIDLGRESVDGMLQRTALHAVPLLLTARGAGDLTAVIDRKGVRGAGDLTAEVALGAVSTVSGGEASTDLSLVLLEGGEVEALQDHGWVRHLDLGWALGRCRPSSWDHLL